MGMADYILASTGLLGAVNGIPRLSRVISSERNGARDAVSVYEKQSGMHCMNVKCLPSHIQCELHNELCS